MTKAKKISLLSITLLLISGVSYAGYRVYEDSQIEVVQQGSSTDETPRIDEPQATIKDDTSSNTAETVIHSGTFGPGDRDYSGSGTALFQLNDDKPTLVFKENFIVSSGPDLQVYISKNKVGSGEDLGEFVSLGELKKQSGSQTYNLPSAYKEYKSVVIWCRAFTAEFSSADLT